MNLQEFEFLGLRGGAFEFFFPLSQSAASLDHRVTTLYRNV